VHEDVAEEFTKGLVAMADEFVLGPHGRPAPGYPLDAPSADPRASATGRPAGGPRGA
jgi:hypothetical protein